MVIDTNAGGVGRNRFHAPTNDTSKSNSASSAGAEKNKSLGDTKTSTDEVSLSGQGQAMSQLESLVKNTPVVDENNVEAIKQAIANGSYSVNPEKIAERMMTDE